MRRRGAPAGAGRAARPWFHFWSRLSTTARARSRLPAAARVLLALLLCLSMASGDALAAAKTPTNRSKQKLAAEAQRAGLQEKLTALKRDISQTESAKDDAADTLAESEAAISDANRELRDLAGEQADTGAKLAQLDVQRDQLASTVSLQKKQLSDLLRDQYMAGNEDRIKLLLSGDNPNRINRDLQMMAYVSQAQARLLAELRTNLAAVETNRAEAQNAKDELDEIAAEQRQQKVLLEQEKARRAVLLASLSKRLVAQRQQAGSVARDEQRMAGLVDKLGKLIEEQAAAAAAEKKRQEQLAQARAEAKAKALAEAQAKAQARAQAAKEAQAERERLAREPGGKNRPTIPKPTAARPDPIDADEPPAVADKASAPAAPAAAIAAPAAPVLGLAAPDGAFASLRGQLRAPVAGKLAARFGSKRGDGPSWKGVFIRASEGSEIHAIAAGRVVFAEWLRGFGNLIIVDHGGQYLSIYGNNQALLKRVGDPIKAGEVIASVGNSGGNEESGLYFELRHQGRTFDPADWVKF